MPRKRASAVRSDPVAAGAVPAPERKAVTLPKGWQRATDALDVIQSVRTCFPDFDRAVRCGGLPVRRLHTIHGPTHGGKTAFALGLLRSFLEGGHLAAYVDAEHATGQEFVSEIMGDLQRFEQSFFAMRPDSYEATIEAVDAFLKYVKDGKAANPHLRSVCLVDSINKLVPKRELENILKRGADELTKGHHGRYRAALNQAWLDRIVPALGAADCAFICIAQERDETDQWAAEDYAIKGGRALQFDASLLIRVSKAKPMYEPAEPKQANIVGFQHRVRIHKSKVGHMDGSYTDCVFHLSNGRFSPAGFDFARDVIWVGKNLGVIKTAGSWLSWGKRRWQGETKAVAWLSRNNEPLAELTADVYQAIDIAAGRAA